MTSTNRNPKALATGGKSHLYALALIAMSVAGLAAFSILKALA